MGFVVLEDLGVFNMFLMFLTMLNDVFMSLDVLESDFQKYINIWNIIWSWKMKKLQVGFWKTTRRDASKEGTRRVLG